MEKTDKIRLDVYLVEFSLCSSRALAKRLILDSSVTVNGKVVVKPSFEVSESDEVKVLENDLLKYVGRGALKLEYALEKFCVSPEGMSAIDIGASTGGFTDVLLKRGAKIVYAVENGQNQLHETLKNHARVVSLENTDARFLSHDIVPMCDMVVMDVSFVSQTQFYKTVRDFLVPNGVFITLIKPQFEAGREYLNKKGIVKDEKIRDKVVDKILAEAQNWGFLPCGVCQSPIAGGDGNVEYLAMFRNEKRRIYREKNNGYY